MNKIRILEKYIHGILALPEVRELLNCSERTVYRIKKRFQHLGPPGLLHGLKNRPSNHQGENTKYHFIISILRRYPKYHDFGPTLLKEHLEEDFGVTIVM